MTNTLDPGYAAAAARRGPGSRARHWYDGAAVAAGCLLVGFTLVLAYLQTHRSAPAAAKVHDGLVSRIHAAERQNAALAGRLAQVNDQLATVRNRALPGSPGLLATIDAEQRAAGEVAVRGPGLQVVLGQPPPPAAPSLAPGNGGTSLAGTNILSDRDVRSVVNQLWAEGAEAISVNDVRLTPTSAIRLAGEAVLVDLQPITSPYTIRAIGDPNRLDTGFAASAVASRYQTLVSADGIGFSFTERKTMTLPAAGPAPLHYARPPTPGASPAGGQR